MVSTSLKHLLYISALFALFLQGCSSKEKEEQAKKAIQAVQEQVASKELELLQTREALAALQSEYNMTRSDYIDVLSENKRVYDRNKAYEELFRDFQTEAKSRKKNILALFAQLDAGNLWISPREALPDSLVKLVGFTKPVLVLYGVYGDFHTDAKNCAQALINRLDAVALSATDSRLCPEQNIQYMIHYPDSQQKIHFILPELTGDPMQWGLYTLSQRFDSGIVFAETDPGTREDLWDWIQPYQRTAVTQIAPAPEINIATQTPMRKMALITTDYLNVRQSSGIHSPLIGRLFTGSIHPIMGETQEWYKINFYDSTLQKRDGWIYKEYVKVIEEKAN